MYIVGDVHGCFLTFKALIKKIGKDSEIYSVGDLVDKGPDTCKLLDFVMSLENFKMVLGNHEIHFIENIEKYINGENMTHNVWYNRFGGNETIASYGFLEKEEIIFKKMREHLNFLKKQEFYYYFNKPIGKINKKIFISHGFALPYFKKRLKVKSDKLTQTQFTCNRLSNLYFDLNDKKNIKELESYNTLNIFGHVANQEVLRTNILMDVDTSCVYGNKLTCYDVLNDKYISTKCIDKVKYNWFE